MPLTRRGFCAATLTAIAAPAILRAQTGAGVEIRAAAAGIVGSGSVKVSVAVSRLNLVAMSRASSRCCFWSSPTGTCVV